MSYFMSINLRVPFPYLLLRGANQYIYEIASADLSGLLSHRSYVYGNVPFVKQLSVTSAN